MDNSNQISEAGFKRNKYNKMKREYEKDAGIEVKFDPGWSKFPNDPQYFDSNVDIYYT